MTIPLLPTLPGWEFPIKKTSLVEGIDLTALSGRRNWYPNYVWPRYQYEISYSVLRGTQTEWQQLQGFFNSVKTVPGGYFYFDDPDDDTVTNQVIGTGNGSNKIFQSVRTLGSFVEPVLGPVVAGAVYKDNGSIVSGAADPTTGIVTLVAAPANTHSVTWTGTYYQICQFDDQSMSMEKFMSGFYNVKSLKFTTIRY